MTSTKPILKSQQSGSAISTKKEIPPAGGGNNRGNSGGGNGGSQNPPSPWLDHPSHPDGKPNPKSASFVEYLRWMRSPNGVQKDATKTQILQMAQEGADYLELLRSRNERTKKIAKARQGEHLLVMCPWRVRVGGHRGPESILLPSFDALGVPYLPSSTLTGVARAAAMREFVQSNKISWKDAEKAIAPYFGSIDAPESRNRAGKVIFLDAYPTPSKSAGLEMDIANNIGQWLDDSSGLKPYKPNPNSFLSLRKVTFLVGICKMPNCDDEKFAKVKKWLIQGLQEGIGSQINSGYGEALVAGEGNGRKPFFEVEFDLEGQLIHGVQEFGNVRQPFQKDQQGNFRRDWQGNLKADQQGVPEVRAIAFKSMLRYWFRTFARGILSPDQAREIEAKIFGGIQPKPTLGWLRVRVEETDPPEDSRNTQSGFLRLYISTSLPSDRAMVFQTLCEHLTWLMFRLGGVGQGARRPYYTRSTNPKIRGCMLIPYSDSDFWQLPDNSQEFAGLFGKRLQVFYQSLRELTDCQINVQTLNHVGQPTRDKWDEVADSDCGIFVFHGKTDQKKKHALAVLHDQQFKPQPDKYDRFLCGSTASPSPVWISNAEDNEYQVVTVFGATQDPRKKFVNELRKLGAIQIFPIA